MAFAKPEYSRGQVRRAGDVLREVPIVGQRVVDALPIITNWRAAHAYPLNTFQATLRTRLAALGLAHGNAPVGQRLKRLPSITTKLSRFPKMQLDRMQDIAGLRAVVPSMPMLRKLRAAYIDHSRFAHELRGIDDYVIQPKDDGYRSVHLVYRYKNARAPQYDGLHVELQLRTHLQHAWATAVETVDAFANQAIKAGRATPQWADFFLLASTAFAYIERALPPSRFHGFSIDDVRERLVESERTLNVLVRLRGFSVAADQIHKGDQKKSAYHLVVLDTGRRALNIRSFSTDELDAATAAYGDAEKRTANGEPIDAVLVAGGSVAQLRKTYPNYFLDASAFIKRISSICNMHTNRASGGYARRRA